MANVAVVGAQWGDEGKGKIVDWLSNRADMVVRFQGGHNAGHTLVVDGKVYNVRFDDWMFLMDDRVMLNRASMSKFGFHLGDVTLSFTKRP